MPSIRATSQLRHVKQPSGTSCGQACVAMIAGTSYAAAKRAVAAGRVSDEDKDYTDATDLRAGLRQLGWRLGRAVRTTEWGKIKNRSLVAVNRKRHPSGKVTWHWVFFEPDEDGGVVLDPRSQSALRGRRGDFRKRQRPYLYHGLTHA